MHLAKPEPRTTQMQAGHQIDADEHELHGFRTKTEDNALEIATIGLDRKVDYSMFYGLDFNGLPKQGFNCGLRLSHGAQSLDYEGAISV